jgi:glycosyltransferase involved in cell wall biosynthesis
MREVSVVMAANNAEEYIGDAIESVLNQSFADFEFIIVNNGSTDKTRSIILSYDNNRIRFFDNESNYIQSLNMGLKAATGKYIVRMDADCICHADRLKIQHAIMEAYPEVAICSGWVNVFGEKTPQGLMEVKTSGLVENPLLDMLSDDFTVYPTTMIRSSFLKAFNLELERGTL